MGDLESVQMNFACHIFTYVFYDSVSPNKHGSSYLAEFSEGEHKVYLYTYPFEHVYVPDYAAHHSQEF